MQDVTKEKTGLGGGGYLCNHCMNVKRARVKVVVGVGSDLAQASSLTCRGPKMSPVPHPGISSWPPGPHSPLWGPWMEQLPLLSGAAGHGEPQGAGPLS